jgi:hypothetical protein
MAEMTTQVKILKSLILSLVDDKINSDEIESRLNMFCQRLLLGFCKYDERFDKIFNAYDTKQLSDIHYIFQFAFESLNIKNNEWDCGFDEVCDNDLFPSYNIKKRKKKNNLIDQMNSLNLSLDTPVITDIDNGVPETLELGPGPEESFNCNYIFSKGNKKGQICNVKTIGSNKCKSHSK